METITLERPERGFIAEFLKDRKIPELKFRYNLKTGKEEWIKYREEVLGMDYEEIKKRISEFNEFLATKYKAENEWDLNKKLLEKYRNTLDMIRHWTNKFEEVEFEKISPFWVC